ncbi:hypothetical protein DL766_008302 [Monosporascus sp. MC13-8B]|uniref:Uncharacterized protein n=1 Tax=Monosporascus cannonballus TaxID=155416 RepID=A0ABY0GYT8_9PEZI|nr:hypothetical protein DL762_007559 [Monosporascus cannonballus]RYO99492.1 hypothetical protein DL763_001516 [Monosporascus cannonballus]RYP20027.1 hypothetical protein DL766_008302 [Monosporascus sp. MC13-8B]
MPACSSSTFCDNSKAILLGGPKAKEAGINGAVSTAPKRFFELPSTTGNQIDAAVAEDVEATTAAIQANGGLKAFDDYVSILYGGTWKNSNPLGETQGTMTNSTQDLLFSMKRLSQNPYPLELVKPSDPLPFDVPEDLAPRIVGVSLDELHKSGSLFVVDRNFLLVRRAD